MSEYIVMKPFWLGGLLYRIGDKVRLDAATGRMFEADFKVEAVEVRQLRRR
ncbi:MAG: hypothetical protein M3009_03215 [Bombella apis]|uniref:hypothetical protein n=1 Tax=Bombella apis TaxID=1785988 RepID=UPI0023F0821D|nr:hypothetical protein [Bombella apis]MCT6819468.1 hypothetical protein [Bombella apis]